MRTLALTASLVLLGTVAASAAPHHAKHQPNRAEAAETVAAPRTTGSLGSAPVQDLGLAGDRANWGRRGPGLPSPINPLGYTGE